MPNSGGGECTRREEPRDNHHLLAQKKKRHTTAGLFLERRGKGRGSKDRKILPSGKRGLNIEGGGEGRAECVRDQKFGHPSCPCRGGKRGPEQGSAAGKNLNRKEGRRSGSKLG